MSEKGIKEKSQHGPIVLLILDGWGFAPPGPGNAVTTARTPVMDELFKKYPSAKLEASGKYVGLSEGQPGNSEAGHMNIGAGRIVDQEAVRISKAVKDKSFFSNPVFIQAIRNVKKNNSKLHLMGMLTQKRSGHADPNHLRALIKLARKQGIKKVYLHLFTDGRDSPQHASLKLVEALIRELDGELIATLMGRFYAMDRKKFWDRTQGAYNAMVLGKGMYANSPQAAITESYNRQQTDEFIPPYVMKRKGKIVTTIEDKDSIIFFNFRSDRARQLSKAFVQKDFERKNKHSFKRKKVLKDLLFVAMTDFGPDLDRIITAYPSVEIKESLSMVLSGLKQYYISESEKYAHVNYFFNGGYSAPIAGETRVRIPSPNIDSYDKTPEMSAVQTKQHILKQLRSYDFIVANFANADMMGHTGNFDSAVKAIEFLDNLIGEIRDAVLKADGTLIITSDHGNAEYMKNPITQEILTEHTVNLVPFIIVSNNKKIKLKKIKLPISCIAPTIIKLFGLPIPSEMTTKDILSNF